MRLGASATWADIIASYAILTFAEARGKRRLLLFPEIKLRIDHEFNLNAVTT